ncbi:hypothetical protein [Deinococcus sp. Leaf326]|uniref:hypothetical protein n=1 Tax=Deinococcus sp. Leaf326 TaxID=1736338 RepID=UPI0006FA90E8|nr:hypothetical protein [Deinococcus sp. Leaf326]KQR33008.1 hypothetical protein ASF71_17190 [Deinococcus sp. Leaf326]
MTLQLKQVVQQEDLRLVQDALTQLEQGERTVTLPSVFTPFLSDLLRHIQQGEALTVVTTEQEFTTNEAAALLGVSRPFLIHNLLDAGMLPSIASAVIAGFPQGIYWLTARNSRGALLCSTNWPERLRT